ncbi:MAG TPA: ferrochelatase [Bryobacteraceae bacterium]|nr:ferrochelatase [Bryobacteraceae bacterium]
MYDALLVVSFGGPEKPEDVMPFLENVTRGRGIPRERLLEVAEHYYQFGGKSPINEQCRALIAALRAEFARQQIELPIYWGNRNWHPLLADTLREMRADGVKHALAFATSAYSSYSGCRQYRENLAAAQMEVGEGAPEIDKLRVFYNHPGFVEACSARVQEALARFSRDERAGLRLVATAHSIPCSMAETSDYEKQLRETVRLVAAETSLDDWDLVYQSRSGPPAQPWLEPDILDHLRSLHAQGVNNVIVAPIGFTSDHMEVVFDLEMEARALAGQLSMKMERAGTAGTHPAFIRAIREIVEERLDPEKPKRAIGVFGPNHDFCPRNCCPAPQRPGTPRVSEVPSVSQQP